MKLSAVKKNDGCLITTNTCNNVHVLLNIIINLACNSFLNLLDLKMLNLWVIMCLAGLYNQKTTSNPIRLAIILSTISFNIIIDINDTIIDNKLATNMWNIQLFLSLLLMIHHFLPCPFTGHGFIFFYLYRFIIIIYKQKKTIIKLWRFYDFNY